jgi:16S rRNA (cytosine1402-N4)-methyltransferase
MHHVPVMLDEVLDFLIVNSEGNYFDGTLGFGGHSSKILQKLDSNAKLIATDKDEDAFKYCKEKFSSDNRVTIYNTSFTKIRTIYLLENIEGFDGIFADLGVSSYQFDNKESGFTYREETVLDLRMDKTVGKPAYEFLNTAKQEEIANVLFQFGEEKKSRRIARKIAQERDTASIKTTTQLKELVEAVIPRQHLNKTLSRIFQALRIYVNNELDELKEFLSQSVELLNSGGRIAILSYHSLEDRIVKEFFKHEALTCICPPEIPVCVCDKESRLKILTKKPLLPSEDEIKINPRARSAKLRVAEKI